MNPVGQVLIVDDAPLNVAMLCDLVRGIEGLEPVGFDDPVAAFEWCTSNTPILVLVDFEMPTLNGAQFVAKLRATEAGSIVPVVVVTAQTDRKKLLKAFAAGANDYVRKPLDELEIVARVRSMSQLGFSARQVAALALTDELTGLATRRHFLSRLKSEIDRARDIPRALSVVMIDVDHFKSINDTGGHDAGDAVLRELSARINKVVRTNDFVGRLGGEEFAWTLPGANLADAIGAAERLRGLLEDTLFVGARHVTASFGVAALKSSDDSISLLQRADRNLYKAKASGRNCVIGEPRRHHNGVSQPLALS